MIAVVSHALLLARSRHLEDKLRYYAGSPEAGPQRMYNNCFLVFLSSGFGPLLYIHLGPGRLHSDHLTICDEKPTPKPGRFASRSSTAQEKVVRSSLNPKGPVSQF